MTKTMKYAGLLAAIVILAVVGCKKDKPKTAPTLTTTAATDITTTTAKTGGTITGTGGDEITGSGVVYSKTNTMPTLSDSKVTSTATSGTFEVDLTSLDPGSNYYIRAYATNSIGTGYGDVKTLMTGNAAPEATNVVINGTVEADLEVTAGYTYSDAENNPESGTSFQWYVADDIAGAGETAIAGATAANYTIDVNYEFKYLRVGVTPKSSAGTPTGVEVKSAFSQIAASTTKVHFTYNGQPVAYGIITSSVTGRQWMDRNLGAQQGATNIQDHLAYGDLFQWGRLTDGHQLINWVQDLAPNAGTAINGSTNQLSTTDVPGHNLFITKIGSPNDWRDPRNITLWQAPDYVNTPCPSGWHIPTVQEWEDEHLETDFVDNKQTTLITNELKLAANGGRKPDGSFSGAGYDIEYWSSERVSGGIYPAYIYGASLDYTNFGVSVGSGWALKGRSVASALPCRCIKDL